jgi:hypothetical protein
MVYGQLEIHRQDLPNPNLEIILNTEYFRLTTFCNHMQRQLSEREIVKLPANDLPSVFTGILRSPRTWLNNTFWRTINVEKKTEKSQAQKDFERKRILSITGAILFMIAYVAWNRIISIEIIPAESYRERDNEANKYDDVDDDDDDDDDEDDDDYDDGDDDDDDYDE